MTKAFFAQNFSMEKTEGAGTFWRRNQTRKSIYTGAYACISFNWHLFALWPRQFVYSPKIVSQRKLQTHTSFEVWD
jgi:hypothetical protein